MKKQKILLGLLVFVLVANFIIPNVVLATDELLDEETVQEEIITDEGNVKTEEETAQEEVPTNEEYVETEEETVQEEAPTNEENVETKEKTTLEEVPAEVSQSHYYDGIYYDSDYIYDRDDVIVRMDENQIFYLPAELAEPRTDTRILQSLFLLDEVGRIAATKKITFLNYGTIYEGSTYRLVEDEEHPLFKVTPVDNSDNYSTTPTKYKIEFLYKSQAYAGDFTYDFAYHNEHKGYGEVYNEETDTYDKHSYFNIYPTLKVHFVRYGKKAELYKDVLDDMGQKDIYLSFNKNNQCILTHKSDSLVDDALFIQEYLNMYTDIDGESMTVYATVNFNNSTLIPVESEDEAIFKITIDNAYGKIDTEYTMTITWLFENPYHISTTTEYIDLLGIVETIEDDVAITSIIHTYRFSPVSFSFIPYLKGFIFDEVINDSGSKNVDIVFDENGKAEIPYESYNCDAEYIKGLLNIWGEQTVEGYMDYDGKTWTPSPERTEYSYVKITGVNITGDTETVAHDLTIELLKELPENKVFTAKEYLEYLRVTESEDEDYKYITYEFNRYSPATITLIPYGEETEKPNYYIENVEINNEDSTAMFEFSINYEKFLKEGTVYLDGKALEKDQYTSRQGSTIIELGKELLGTLSNGIHTLKVQVSDGYAEAQFAIEKPNEPEAVGEVEVTQPVKENPNTADYAPIMAILFIASVLGIAYSHKRLVVNQK